MVMNTIRELKEINGKPILHMDDLAKKYPEHFNKESGQMDYKWFEKEIRPNFHIYARHDVDSLTFNMLTKPASEGGDLNRCQLVDLISVAKHMIEYLNKDYPCRENAMTITKLDEALMWQTKRTADRVARNVEGRYEK